MKQMKKAVVVLAVLAAVLGGCAKKSDDSAHIAVFIPGVRAGSAIYEMLADGVEQGATEWQAAHSGRVAARTGRIAVNVIEGGYNQAEWENGVTALAASGMYDVIVSSNPSLPAIVAEVLKKFPAQKFILFDGELAGNESVYSLRYNQREQGYMAGHIAAQVSEELGGSKKIGLVAGQEYPAMNEIILPAYLEGARAVDAAYSVDFRVLGNWFDAQKAADLAQDMINGGARVILAVSGGANEGILRVAEEKGAKVVWFDTNGYALKPGVVVGSAVLYQDKAARDKTLAFLDGTLQFGRAEVAGVGDGYVDFVEDDPVYAATVSEGVRQKQAALVARMRSGTVFE
jgi:simple sugar transport system substrate-binding protein